MPPSEEDIAEVVKAISPLPEGTEVKAGAGGILVVNEADNLGFLITDAQIRDNRHTAIAKAALPYLLDAITAKRNMAAIVSYQP